MLALASLIHSRLIINAIYSVSFKYSFLGVNVITEWMDTYATYLSSLMDKTFGVYISGILASTAVFLAIRAVTFLDENIKKLTWSELRTQAFCCHYLNGNFGVVNDFDG